jgi:hypothetical protein
VRPSSPRPRLAKPSARSQRSQTTCPSGPTRTSAFRGSAVHFSASVSPELREPRLPVGWSNHPPVSLSGRFEPQEGRRYQLIHQCTGRPGRIPTGSESLFMMDRFNVRVGSLSPAPDISLRTTRVRPSVEYASSSVRHRRRRPAPRHVGRALGTPSPTAIGGRSRKLSATKATEHDRRSQLPAAEAPAEPHSSCRHQTLKISAGLRRDDGQASVEFCIICCCS